ncbi:MAG: hypothetical protein LBU30_03955 [Candidatus Methanoplasma sp.]|jgi:hypothetical protein|nr:hypothetical protein [Candidatus Methanoplasma sp.]
MGSDGLDRAADNLLGLRKKMASETSEPAFLAIVSGGGAYMRGDDVAVVPIDCLGP